MNREAVITQAQAAFEEIREARRHLHQYPELGTREHKTQRYIMDFLDRQGIPYVPCADTGIVATVEGRPGGRVVALRADIDALPIQETGDVPYCSRHDGVMHACGHDVHTAINMGAAKLLGDNRERFSGTAKLFFQPAEESEGGAQRMVQQGCMENPKVDSVIGLHVMPNYGYDHIEYRYGAVNASTNMVRLTVQGKRGHGAYPDRCVDAIVIAAHIITALQTAVSRTVSPLDSAVFTAGTIQGGEAGNIIAGEVVILGTIRASSPAVRALMHSTVTRVAQGVAQSLGGQCQVDMNEGYLPLINDSQVLDVILEEARGYLGAERIHEKPTMSMGGEDFSFFNQHTPGAFYNLGCRIPERQEDYILHTAAFDVDERCLVTGMVLQTLSALRLMGN